MNMHDVLLYALNHQALVGCDFSKKALSKKVRRIFKENGVDVDKVVQEVEDNEGGELDLF